MTCLRLGAAIAVGLLAFLGPRISRACPAIPSCREVTLPQTGAAGVPLNAGLVVGPFDDGAQVQLEKDGVPVWTSTLAARFSWDRPDCLASFDVPTLEPNTTYVLKSGGAELTRFTTGTKIDAAEGTRASIRSLSVLVRRYPPEMQVPSMCLQCATADIASVDFDPAVFPDTPANSVLYTWALYPEGSPAESPYPQRFGVGSTYLGCKSTRSPCQMSSCASRKVGDRYCAKVWAWGIPYAPDKAVVSEEVCTSVTFEEVPGWTVDAGPGGGGANPSGCSTTGGAAWWLAPVAALGTLLRRRLAGRGRSKAS